MSQLISRPTVYLVIGIGVLALLVSQFRSAGHQAPTSVSELDPFRSLEDLSGSNLIKSNPDMEAVTTPTNINPVEVVRDHIVQDELIQDELIQDEMVQDELVQDEMVRDEMTSVTPYQQTAAANFNNTASEAHAVAESTGVKSLDLTFQLADVNAVQTDVPTANPINPIDDSLTVLELAAPTVLDAETPEERYKLEDVAATITDVTEEVFDPAQEIVESNTPNIDSIAMIEEPNSETQPLSAFEKNKALVMEGNSVRPREWKKNPFIVEPKSASEAVEVETSSNESSIELDSTDSFSIDTAMLPEMSEADQVSTVGNFEAATAPLVVSDIPSTDQPIQSVMTNGEEFGQYGTDNESLPVVIGLPDSVAHKAVHNIEYGKSLSRRGAAFAARQEFYSSLRILAQAHDTQAGGTAYTGALRDAIIALKEAEDFIVSDTETQIGLNVDAVIEGHSTKLIPLDEAANITAIGAMQRYFAFASTQLRVASGQNAVAAEALYCLGKLHTVQAKFAANASKLDIAKAIVFHQAAIASDHTNFRSANELGVLMANSGRLQEAQDMLKRSLKIQQLPQAWQNLAVVHQRSGQDQLAQLAQLEFLASSRQTNTPMAHNTIRWVDPSKFNQGTPLELRQGAAQPPQFRQPASQQNTGKPTISQRLKSLF